jgi:DNA invertase Pin-like site-specific DNA recombinase
MIAARSPPRSDPADPLSSEPLPSTPAGKALFQMMGVFAEFERAMIRERVRSGLERAKAQGKRLGRPRNDDAKQRAAVIRLRQQGVGMGKIARELGVGASYVQRIAADLASKDRRPRNKGAWRSTNWP